MKIAPVSADLLVKIALGAAIVGAALYGLNRVRARIADALPGVDGVLTAINPADPGNIVNTGITALGDVLTSDTGPGRNADGSWTLGGWLYDVLHGDQINYRITGKPPQF